MGKSFGMPKLFPSEVQLVWKMFSKVGHTFYQAKEKLKPEYIITIISSIFGLINNRDD
jgi:hypothetical protein